MSDFDDLPVIQVFPNGTPSDEEWEAMREADHARALALDRVLDRFT